MAHEATQPKADRYAGWALEFVESALNPRSGLYREHGPDRLLAAAQVYATLSIRQPIE